MKLNIHYLHFKLTQKLDELIKIMNGNQISSFSLPIDIETFKNSFWGDSFWFEKFLSDYLEDLSVNVGDWNIDEKSKTEIRQIRSYHPSKVSFPGLPSHAESLKSQKLVYKPYNCDIKDSEAILTMNEGENLLTYS